MHVHIADKLCWRHTSSGKARQASFLKNALTSVWGLCLGLLLLQGCTTTLEGLPPEKRDAPPDGTWYMGKRFRPGKPRLSPQPSSTPAQGSSTPGTRDPSSAASPSRTAPPPPRSVGPSYRLGESDGGPGKWEKAPVRPKGSGYQHQVTGAPEETEYAVPARTPSGKVLFDGYRDGKLLDAKDWEKWPPKDTRFWQDGVLDDARKQLDAARGTPIEWHLPSEDKAEAVRELFEREDLRGIIIKVTRKK